MKTIRLIYPQWQGGDIARWIPEIDDRARSARGYWLGAQLLNFLVPAGNNQETYTVPVSLDPCERTVTDGVMDRDIIAAQTAAALDILKVAARTASSHWAGSALQAWSPSHIWRTGTGTTWR